MDISSGGSSLVSNHPTRGEKVESVVLTSVLPVRDSIVVAGVGTRKQSGLLAGVNLLVITYSWYRPIAPGRYWAAGPREDRRTF